MSTIPLTLIEGAVAMPRVRPLRHVPTSFGRDWALLPPPRNWRAELKALYAAVLHTFCLTDQAILSLCKWVPLDARRAAAGLASSASALKRATVDAAAREPTARVVDEGVIHSTTIEAPVYRQPNGRSVRLGAVAGGACAIGGVAVLAWVAFGHPQQRYPASSVKSADVAIVSPGSEPAKRQATEAAATTGPHAGEESAKVRSTTLARVEAKPVVASAAVVAPASASRDVSRDDAIARRNSSTHTLGGKSPSLRANARHGIERKVRVTTTRHDRSRIAVPQIASRKSPAPSAAGDYSPLMPADLGIDEYESVTMSAATHLRPIVQRSRIATSADLTDPGGTRWSGRMSQRRVTDIPEQFSK
ncbi:hypothetical protein ABH945_000437 [Paraburkholderia sp. GAS333]|uniref:hypothetical protein n=1 Tax=Paraburkholderia sp. GAS333 TaxID=3156279 RepID=UPI003D1EC926